MRREDWADRLAEELGDLLLDERTTGEVFLERVAQELRKAYLAGLEDVDVRPDVEDTSREQVHLFRPSIPASVMENLPLDVELPGTFVEINLSRMTWIGRKPDPEPDAAEPEKKPDDA